MRTVVLRAANRTSNSMDRGQAKASWVLGRRLRHPAGSDHHRLQVAGCGTGLRAAGDPVLRGFLHPMACSPVLECLDLKGSDLL